MGTRCGVNCTVAGAPAIASSPISISGRWRWVAIPYALTLSSTAPKVRPALSPRPAPVTPDIESTTIGPSISPAPKRGPKPSSAEVG